MDQQLLQGTVNITPQTMTSVLQQLAHYIASPQLSDETLSSIVKGLFYGLWNFDKMINQHNLSTAISLLPLQLPKQVRKNGLRFYEALYGYLYQKMNQQVHATNEIFNEIIFQFLQINENKTIKS